MNRDEVWRLAARRVRRTLLLALVVPAPALACAAGAAAAASFGACHDGSRIARCARVRVPLDHGGVVAGTIDLNVRIEDSPALPRFRPGVRLRPGSGHRSDRVVLVLADGAGEPATRLLTDPASDLADQLDPLAHGGRLLAFDRRGTGASGRISCPALDHGSATDPGVAAACAAQLGPARAFYTTRDSVEDVEAVRGAVGVERLTIFGVGEGARLALAYAAAHLEHVERIVLDSPVPLAGADPLRRSTFAAVKDFVQTALCLRACGYARDPVAELTRLAQRAAVAPLRGSVIDGHGRRRPQPIGVADLAALLVGRGSDATVSELPALAHSALHGDLAPLSRAVAGLTGSATSPLPDAASLVAACEDGPLPWTPETPLAERRAALDAALARLPAGDYAPFGIGVLRTLGTAEACLDWPDAPAASAPQPPPHVPTLILSGEWDLHTPQADAAALARAIPGAQLLTVPATPHGVIAHSDPFTMYDRLASCAPRALGAFARGGRVKPCPRTTTQYDRARPRPLRGAAWGIQPLPASFAAVRPSNRRVPPRLGRTLTAARMTMYDPLRQLVALQAGATFGSGALRLGGLRGGWALLGRRDWRLHDYELVPGVTLSLSFRPRRRLRIGGSKAVHGVLTQIGRCGESSCFVGRLGGRRVHVIIPGTA